MFDPIMTALEQGEFTRAGRLLKAWQEEAPQDPWLKLALARYWEATHELEKAETAYRRLLQQVTNAKLMTQARQGIQRVQDQQARQREHLLDKARAQPGAEAPGLLVLEPVQGELREAAAAGLAQVMRIDPYTARLLLPGQYWRLYRVGPIGELQYFCQTLAEHQTPAFCLPVSPLIELSVFRVQHVQALQPQVSVVCQNDAGQLGSIAFDWSEVSQWVTGQVPVLESVVDLGPRGHLTRKEVTQDYAEIIDLHLHSRNCVLRFCDRTYTYRQSVSFTTEGAEAPSAQVISRVVWDALKQLLTQKVGSPTGTDFSGFGKTALEFINLLPTIPTHLDLMRRAPSPWDQAFHLYSSLHFSRFSP
ncbi:MAG TPA: tetratricopeptide repeat protein [Leptolyngbyaceae cyanobacterium]